MLVLSLLLTGSLPARAEPVLTRVMSFNVRYGTAADGENHWEKRRAWVAATIRAFDPDLLGTQEPLAFQRDYLAAQLPGFTVLGVGREDGKEAGEMTALFYRSDRYELLASGHFWLSETPEVAGSRSWDSSLPRMATWVRLRERKSPAALPVFFLNTHFDHKGETARREAARIIRLRAQQEARSCRVIVTGDFNAGEGSAPYVALFGALDGSASPLRDAFRVAVPERGEEEGTFSGFRADALRGPRIDWIGVSGSWRVREARIDRTARDGRTPSDHFPMTAIIADE